MTATDPSAAGRKRAPHAGPPAALDPNSEEGRLARAHQIVERLERERGKPFGTDYDVPHGYDLDDLIDIDDDGNWRQARLPDRRHSDD